MELSWFSLGALLALAWLAMALAMAGLWFVQSRLRNAGVVDVGWTLGVGALGVVFAALAIEGQVARRAMVAVIVGVWSLRLGTHIIKRLMSEPEDGRYQALKRHWGAAAQHKLFWFFQIQALGAVLFALPMLLAARNPTPLAGLDFLAVAVWCVSLAGESLADRQLARFKADQANRGRVCNVGLWRYSRHPNYFFEWLHWWIYVLLAWTGPGGWLALLAPLAMLYLLLYVTGIPPTEAQAVRSRGEAYRQYQRTTSAFVPWWPTQV